MRIFEILLFVASICLWLKRIWGGIVLKSKVYWILFFSADIILFLHIIIECARWQMSFIYISLIIGLILESVSIYKGLNSTSNSLTRSVILTFILGIFALISISIPVVFPVFKLAEPTGVYSVGTSNYIYTDQSRKVSNGGPRKINVQIWYPAEIQSSIKKEKYTSNLSEYSAAIQKVYGVPKHLLSYLSLIDSHAYKDAPFTEKFEKAPVIFFSHGNMMGQRFTNTFQALELASHGYIVVAVEHPETALMSVYSNSDFVTFKDTSSGLPMEYEVQNRASKPVIEQQTLDIEFVLKQIQDMNEKNGKSTIIGRMDFDKLGIIGHSQGGATAVDVMYKNKGFKAAIDMDGYLYGEERMEALDRPLLIMNGKFEYEELKDSIEMSNSEQARRKIVLGDLGTSIDIKEAGHLSFTDIPLYSPIIKILSPKTKQNHKIINELTLVFLNNYFKEDIKDFNSLLDTYPEISLGKI
jgi:dienelactone hydrolase